MPRCLRSPSALRAESPGSTFRPVFTATSLPRPRRWPPCSSRAQLDGRATWFICPLLNPLRPWRAARGKAKLGSISTATTAHLEAPEVGERMWGWVSRAAQFRPGDLHSRGLGIKGVSTSTSSILTTDPAWPQPMIKAAAKACPIDMSPVIEGREAKGESLGPSAGPCRAVRNGRNRSTCWPTTHASPTLVETPSCLPLEVRVAALQGGSLRGRSIGLSGRALRREELPRAPGIDAMGGAETP